MKVAIIGATGAVGRQMISELEDSSIQNIELGLFASPRSEGQSIDFNGLKHSVKAFSLDAIKDYEYVLMSAGGSFSKANAKEIAAQGAVVIDNSSAWRMDPEIPLIVPEVNGDVLKNTKNHTIIANPNCSTIQMVVSLAPLKKHFGLDMVQVSTYQSVSGTGQQGINELASQIKNSFNMHDHVPQVYAQPIAFNVLPAIGPIDENGHCEEEIKMVKETQKIFSDSSINVMASTVRVPVFSCHCESITVKLKKQASLAEISTAMQAQDGLVFVDSSDQSKLPTPSNSVGKKETFVSRLRLPYSDKTSVDAKHEWLQFWNVADNLKKGAATNAVQILEALTAS